MDSGSVDIRKLKAGDEAEWTLVHDLYVNAVFGFVYQRVGKNRELARDLTQQAFLTAFRRIGDYDESYPNFLAWLMGIAKNTNHALKRETRELPASGLVEELPGDPSSQAHRPNPSPHEALLRLEEDEILEGILGSMPENMERAIRLRYCEDLSHREIGERLNLTEKGAEMTVRRARKYLQEAYFKVYPYLAPRPPKPQECPGG
jgi:RNA polymerase sigma-70 factor (ECF subfamily)